MTNLVLLAMCATTNFLTNSVSISCEEAACTNQVEYEEVVEVTPKTFCAFHKRNWYGIVPDGLTCECIEGTFRKEKKVGCQFWHHKSVRWPVCIITKYRIGTKDLGELFFVQKQKVLPEPENAKSRGGIISMRGTYWNDGAFLGYLREDSK